MHPNPYDPPVTTPTAFCNFCRRSYVDTGPLVQAPDAVLICYDCAVTCQKVLEDEAKKRGVPPGKSLVPA